MMLLLGQGNCTEGHHTSQVNYLVSYLAILKPLPLRYHRHVLHGESWELEVSQIPKTDCHVAVPHHLLKLGERVHLHHQRPPRNFKDENTRVVAVRVKEVGAALLG